MRTLRIGSGAGYGGDRIEPAIDLIRRGNLDYIIFECLAERTIALAQIQKQINPKKGYNELFEYRMDKILDALKELKQQNKRPVKVITNMGAANPVDAAKLCYTMARSKGINDLKIAALTGDDLRSNLDDFMGYTTIETGRALSEIDGVILSANAYIGCEGIVEALENGADIIITGRVADPSLTLGALVHEFGWSMSDYDKLGKGTIAGHLLECAGQVTGGYFCDPGIKDVPDLWNLGFPIAEINEVGETVITKLPDTGGLVSEMTCKEQILYEIQDPTSYYTPDCTADFSMTEVRQIAPDKVSIAGVTGRKDNDLFKVSVGYKDCFIGEGSISYGGQTALGRAKLAEEVVRKRLEIAGCHYDEIHVDYIGVNSLYGSEISGSLLAPSPYEVRLRVAARTKDAANAKIIGDEVEALYTNGPAGGGGVVKEVHEIVSIASILIPKDIVKTKLMYWEV